MGGFIRRSASCTGDCGRNGSASRTGKDVRRVIQVGQVRRVGDCGRNGKAVRAERAVTSGTGETGRTGGTSGTGEVRATSGSGERG